MPDRPSIAVFDPRVLDAMPLMVFLVDDDVGVLHANTAARKQLDTPHDTLHGCKGGDILQCIHATETPGGCGCSAACKNCVVRNSVNRAVMGGTTTRAKAVNVIYSKAGISRQHLLITATPFTQPGEKPQVLLVIEDITDLVELKNLIPICSCCKSIRNTDDTWERVENYLHKQLDLNFTHGICPECAEKLYPGIGEKIREYHVTGLLPEPADASAL